jgi:hypothetical protein
MAGLSKITVNRGQGGLGRRALSADGISGIIFFNASAPTGMVLSTPVKIFSLEEAEGLGIIEGAAFDVYHYHISEFFRANPAGQLWVGFFALGGVSHDYLVETEAMRVASAGEIRLLAVYAPEELFATILATVASLQAALDLFPSNQRVSAFLATDMSAVVAVTGWGTVGDLRTLTDESVTVVVGQDGAGRGSTIFTTIGESVSVIGRILGDHSAAAVNQSVGEVGVFNISNGVELEVPAMGNGDLVSALTETALGAVKDKGYAVIRKRLPDVAGTYHERTPVAVAFTSDFAFIENNRVVDKATRLLTAAYTPYLNSRLLFKDDGSLADDVIGFFTDLGQDTLDGNLEAVGEISASEVSIDPTQNVLATSTLVVSAKILPTAIAEFITINISLTAEL